MATEQTRRKPREADSAYLKMRAEYRAALADMEIEIKPEDYADAATGLLNGPRLLNGLTVHIPAWPNVPPPGETDIVVLYLDNGNGKLEEVAKHEFTVPAGGGSFPETFPYPMTIEVNKLPDDATCWLQYIITDYTGFETPSSEKTVICDRLPPYKHVPPAAPVITGDFLDDSNLPAGGRLTVTIPGYPDWHPTDQLAIYLVDSDNIPEDPTATPPIFAGNAPAPGTYDSAVPVDADKIRAFGDANAVFTYAL
ncbi:hypothetical protein [Pseudomonas sp. GM55]|uniref:hypothetical protein n=1 Tax=Pseudomonas sp. GM55 TaxID=1144333 RepID=UPI00027067D2|nr:hypothetical protein [Pseudomonas sp. GM55]EJM69727.1 hypothetical protein PMI31_04612 [Pseudomonas sp. GM55]